jgi:riboflavin synthase
MFTGIITEIGKILSIQPEIMIVSGSQILNKVELGCSIAVNGTCLTVTQFDSKSFTVGLAEETLKRTNLGSLKNGDPVNLERALALGGELGGHLVQGHIDGTGRITALMPASGSTIFRFEAPLEIMKYVVEKGFIAIEGISLTIAKSEIGYFETSVVDYTKNNTNLKFHEIGDPVNLEVDVMAKYVERFMQSQSNNLTKAFLMENGF